MADSHPPTNGTAPVLGAEIAQPDGELRNSASPKSSPKMMAAGDSHMEPDPMEGRPESPPKSSTQPAQPTHHAPSSTASTTLTKGQTTSSSPTAPTTPSPPQAYPQPTNQPGSHAGPSSHQPLPSPKLLSTHLIAHPSDSAGRAMKKVFPNPNPIYRLVRRFKVKHSVIDGLTPAEEKRWNAEGAALRRRAGWRLKDEPGEGVPVSELFWKMYISLLPTLQRDPLSGLVPPDLMGSTTTMPLSIISLIPDIMQHYRDVIIRAEKEIFLATNYWQPSNSVNTISQSLRDLSALVLKSERPKVVVKIMYDRGSWEQLWNAHSLVNPKEWAPLDLPIQEDVKGLELEVVNFHRVLLGTFHAKFLVVDRKVALLNSNNIQDRPNIELMSHFEGPVVDAFYEIALHSWYNRLSPPLPCMTTPFQPPCDRSGQIRYLFQDYNPYFDDIEIMKAARAARLLLRRQTKELSTEEPQGRERFRDTVRKVLDERRQTFADWNPGEELEARRHLAVEQLRDFRERFGLSGITMGRSGSRGPSRRASAIDVLPRPEDLDVRSAATTVQNAVLTLPPAPYEAASPPTMINDAPLVSPDDEVLDGGEAAHDAARPHVMFLKKQDFDGSGRLFPGETASDSPVDSHLAHGNLLENSTMMDSPTTSSLHLPADQSQDRTAPEPIDGRRSPTNENGDSLPMTAQTPEEIERSLSHPEKPETNGETEKPGGSDRLAPSPMRKDSVVPEGVGSKRLYKLSKRFNAAGVLSEAPATVYDSDDLNSFRPHVVHAPHDPFPVAMCCRKPHGLPGHHDIRNPQNAAWLAGFRYAKRKIFVQTPTLNARPIVRAIKQACRRGVNVTLFLDLGFNDKGESIPFQGGTNEEVVDRLSKILRKDKKEQYLKVYWYTGKDQIRPLNAVFKQRNCHIKFAAFDDEVLIIGNGNQDSQSWFHSQEVNVMLDNKQIIAEMMDTLLSNQNTLQYGLVGDDGTWRDKDGKTLQDYGSTSKGQFRGLSAFITFAKSI